LSPRASAIVPTRNSARTLVACLESLGAQTQPVEIVVVDNASSDGTRRIAEGLADQVVLLGPERSAQRNAGARMASGDCLLFVDSDMVVEPAVAQECIEAVEGGAGAVVIPETSFGNGFWARCKSLERSCYVGDESIEAARCFTRRVFEECGGFDESLPAGPEDWDLDARARTHGAKVGRTSAMIHHDEGDLRLCPLVCKKYYYGKAMAEYARRHPGRSRKQLRLVRPAFLRHGDRLLADPLAASGMALMKVSEFAAGAAGLVSARLAGDSRP
jgi:glycosyltransferase involved in cell wall biosynthesis